MVKVIRYMFPSIVVGFVVDIFLKGTCSINDVINHLLIPSTGYWYLVVLTIFNLTLFVYHCLRRKGILADVSVAVLFYFLFFVVWKKGGSIGSAFNMEHCACYYPFFILGFLFRKYDRYRGILKNNRIFTLSALLYVVLLYSSFESPVITKISERLIIPLLGIAAIVYVFAKRENCTSKIETSLSFFGKNSLNIYLFHSLILYNIDLRALMRWFVETNNTFFELFVSAVVCILMSLCAVYIGKFIMLSDFVRDYVYGGFIIRKGK